MLGQGVAQSEREGKVAQSEREGKEWLNLRGRRERRREASTI